MPRLKEVACRKGNAMMNLECSNPPFGINETAYGISDQSTQQMQEHEDSLECLYRQCEPRMGALEASIHQKSAKN